MAGKGKPGPAPGQRFGGRQKGTPNKLSGDVRAMILAALNEVGGHSYLVEQARANPTAFLTLVGKILPMQVNTTVKRDIRELSEAELLAIVSSAGIAGPTSGENEDRAVH
jgi:hypothetical protein